LDCRRGWNWAEIPRIGLKKVKGQLIEKRDSKRAGEDTFNERTLARARSNGKIFRKVAGGPYQKNK